MVLRLPLSGMVRSLGRCFKSRPPWRGRARPFRPWLECLEDRSVPALFGPALNYGTDAGPISIAVGDVDNDGTPDLVVGNAAGSVSVLLGNADGTFQPERRISGFIGFNVSSVALAEFRGDGNLDIAATNRVTNTVDILLGNGDGTFQLSARYPVGPAPVFVAAADLNNDGNVDLVTANAYGGSVSVLLGNGDGTFQAPRTFTVGNFPSSVAVGDFDHDGNLDLAVTNLNDGTVSILLGNGHGSFQPQRVFRVGQNASGAQVADFNGDGNLDIVVVNPNDNLGQGTVGVLLGNGDGTFQPQRTFPTNGFPNAIAVADFDGDGKLDLAVANIGSVSVLLGNGDGTFQPQLIFSAGAQPVALGVGDFNGDLAPDLAVANYQSANVSVLLNESPVAASLDLSAPDDEIAGMPFAFTVTARNQFGGAFAGYTGTVHFTSSDGQATLPDDYSFRPEDRGAHTFTAALRTAGSQILTVEDGKLAGEANVLVAPAAAASLRITGPDMVAVNEAFAITVTALDGFGNIASGYTGTVELTSSDHKALLPDDYTFLSVEGGVHTFTVALSKPGQRSITVTDIDISTIMGSIDIEVIKDDRTTIRLWDMASGKLLAVLSGHRGEANSLAFSRLTRFRRAE